MISPVVMDTSAVLAVVLRERGSDVVKAIKARRLMSAVNVAEVYAKLVDKGFDLRAIDEALRRLDIQVEPFDAMQARYSGELRRGTKDIGISLGDRACLALGIVKAAIIYTADQVWAGLDLPVDLKFIR